MKYGNSILFFVVFCMCGYVSASDNSCLAPARKKSVTEQQLEAGRKVERARRETLFGYMRDGIQLATIPEGTCSIEDKSNKRQSPSGSNSVSLQAVATREETSLKEKTTFDMPSFAPLYKGVYHTLNPSGKKPIFLLDRVLTKIPYHPDEDHSKNQLHIDESD